MLTIPPTTQLWYGGTVDLRVGFDGLYRYVQSTLDADPRRHRFPLGQTLHAIISTKIVISQLRRLNS